MRSVETRSMMPAGVWRCLALTGALLALAFVTVETVRAPLAGDDHLVTQPADGRSYARLRVTAVTGTAHDNGGLLPGDAIVPLFPYTTRARLGVEPAGTVHRWSVERAGARLTATTYGTPLEPNDVVLFEIFNAIRLAMIVMAIVVAVRRPEAAAARALVTFLALLGLTLATGGSWLPDPVLDVWFVLRGPLEIVSLSQGLLYACIFPFASTGGMRDALRRINPWYTLVTACGALGLSLNVLIANAYPDLGPVPTLIEWSPMAYFVAIAAAFWIAAANARGADRLRVYWAAGSICAGFTGPIVVTLLEFAFHYTATWVEYLALTLIALPVGLAYTILRHRTIDIGFVISRALVLTVLSAFIVLCFGLLERLLGKLFIDASHIASRTVEIALALGLGFSLRGLHARIESIVDRIFFRRRRQALAALRTFCDDVYFITDPDAAIERTVEVVDRATDASNAALFLIADGVFGCAAAVDASAFPSEIGENERLFVRMRASRRPQLARDAASELAVEIAFPMFVRATLVGALVLTAKRTGEAYDPEEIALLADLAQRVGVALDALQTVVMRRELEALMGATGGAAAAL